MTTSNSNDYIIYIFQHSNDYLKIIYCDNDCDDDVDCDNDGDNDDYDDNDYDNDDDEYSDDDDDNNNIVKQDMHTAKTALITMRVSIFHNHPHDHHLYHNPHHNSA